MRVKRISVHATALVLGALLLLPLCGCWDYKDIKKLNVVAGIAVDHDDETDEYVLSFELIDLSKSLKQDGLNTLFIQGRGRNISEAVNSVRYYLNYNLYFGNSQFLLIHEGLARNEGLRDMLDWFTREYEIKDTTYVCLANTEKASDILEMDSLDKGVVSYEMLEILNYDKKATVFVRPVSLYRVQTMLRGEGRSLTLPVFGAADNVTPEQSVPELCGMGLFKDDKLCDILPIDESRYLLFAWGERKMATLVYDLPSLEGGYITVDIVRSETKRDYRRDGSKFTFCMDIQTHCVLEELKHGEYLAGEKKTLENELADRIKENLLSTMDQCRVLGADAPEFGRMIYQKEPNVWKTVREDWPRVFADAGFEVSVEVKIENPGVNQNS